MSDPTRPTLPGQRVQQTKPTIVVTRVGQPDYSWRYTAIYYFNNVSKASASHWERDVAVGRCFEEALHYQCPVDGLTILNQFNE